MNRRSFVLTLAAAAAPGAARADSAAAAPAAIPAHLRWARLLVTDLLAENNAYGSHPTFVDWANRAHGRPARNRSVCSSFVTRLLERAYGFGTADVESWTGLRNPQAKDYYAAIAGGHGFSVVPHIAGIAPGDFVSLRYPPHSRPTGHIMLADGTPTLRDAAAPLHAGTKQYTLRVIDSSTTGHGGMDTRRSGAGWTTGVGSGVIRLYADDAGTIVGHAWSRSARSKFYGTGVRALVIGRLHATPPRGGAYAAETAPFADDAPQAEA